MAARDDSGRRLSAPARLGHAVGGRIVEALTFVADPRHEAYAGELSLVEAAARIGTARGLRGTNRDYLSRTLEQLETLGIRDGALASLGRAVAEVPA
ncbi:MAG: gamma-glutamylcyclotransferase [Aliidongia sp.]